MSTENAAEELSPAPAGSVERTRAVKVRSGSPRRASDAAVPRNRREALAENAQTRRGGGLSLGIQPHLHCGGNGAPALVVRVVADELGASGDKKFHAFSHHFECFQR